MEALKIVNVWLIRTLSSALALVLFLLISCKPQDVNDVYSDQQVDNVSFDLPNSFQGYQFKWGDEFNDTTLDESKWGYRTGNSKESFSIPDVVSVSDGKMTITGQKTPTNGKKFSGGGIYSKQKFKYGYFEVRAKMEGKYGWHEAFWATLGKDLGNQPAGYKTTPRIEIDCFEHFKNYEKDKFSWGIIRWYPDRLGVIRDQFVSPNLDVSADYHTWSWEYTPDYFVFYFDRQKLGVVPTNFPNNDYHIWLTMIATLPDAANSSTLSFDYFRSYEIDVTSSVYKQRKDTFLLEYYGPQSSEGIDLWIEAENMAIQGGWTKISENIFLDYLLGHNQKVNSRPSKDLSAFSLISVPEAGTYKLWVRSRDFNNGRRTFQVRVNGIASEVIFGDHNIDGWEWEYGGSFELSAGKNQIELYDNAQFFGRCDKILLTTDQKFRPAARGGVENVVHHEAL